MTRFALPALALLVAATSPASAAITTNALTHNAITANAITANTGTGNSLDASPQRGAGTVLELVTLQLPGGEIIGR